MSDETRDTGNVLKRRTAEYAASLVKDGMVVGLGTGSTAHFFVEAVIARVRSGLHIVGVPTSDATEKQAREGGITITSLDDNPRLDMVIDGADEVDPNLNLIKGMGGALLREKIVASSTKRLVIIVDGSKLVPRLGDHTPVPVEVVPFGWTRVEWALREVGARPVRRMAGQIPFVSDGGHFILDCWFDPSFDLISVAPEIKALTGVVEHGLFLGMAAQVIVGRDESVEVITKPSFDAKL